MAGVPPPEKAFPYELKGVTTAGVDVQKMEQASNSVSLTDGLIWVPNIGVWKKKAITVSVSVALLTHLIYAPFVRTNCGLYGKENLKVVRSFAANWKKARWMPGMEPHTSKVSSFFERWGSWMDGHNMPGCSEIVCQCFAILGISKSNTRRFEGFDWILQKDDLWIQLNAPTKSLCACSIPISFSPQLTKPGTRSDSSICHGVI